MHCPLSVDNAGVSVVTTVPKSRTLTQILEVDCMFKMLVMTYIDILCFLFPQTQHNQVRQDAMLGGLTEGHLYA